MFDFRKVVVFFGVLICGCDELNYLFEEVSTTSSGVEFTNQLTNSTDLNILNYLYFYNGAGVAVADFNSDGRDDLFFTGNQTSDKMYLNKGKWQFEALEGFGSALDWSTGVTHVDINQDGLLDLYVCTVSGVAGLEGQNRLYVNHGLDEDEKPIFIEEAEKYGLAISALSTQSVFLDFDLDGDLDMFLMCHSVYPNRSYGHGSMRKQMDARAGDRFFENRDGKYVDVSASVGLHQGKIGYGLGVSVADFNSDGYPDIYVGNDFFENDYLYLNDSGRYFNEVISSNSNYLGHTSHYSMGNSAADLNQDGLMDLFSLDMLPEDITTLKSSGAEDPFSVYQRYLSNGYAPQYMQNTLHLNRGVGFGEVAFQAGVAATEWSWGVLIGDWNLDGFQDIHITNGIPGATNDMDYIKFMVQGDVQRNIEMKNEAEILAYIKRIPAKKVSNYFFENKGLNQPFEDRSDEWAKNSPGFSNGSAMADLDGDGDLDLVISNINSSATLLKNTVESSGNHFLKIRFKGSDLNRNGIGAKVNVFTAGQNMTFENFPVRSYLSTSANYVVAGLGKAQKADSVAVKWPTGETQVIYNVKADQEIAFDISEAKRNDHKVKHKISLLINDSFSISYQHNETSTLDFDRNPLVPFALSNEGPAMASADIDGDGLEDLFFGGAKKQLDVVFSQVNGEFNKSQKLEGSSDSEAIDAAFFDADSDGDQDLIVVSGGNEFTKGNPLRPRFYRNESGKLVFDTLLPAEINASSVDLIDLESDGDLDILIGASTIPWQFGSSPEGSILLNDGKGQFTQASSAYQSTWRTAKNMNDIVVIDLNKDGNSDVVVVGDWMPIQLLVNEGTTFSKKQIPNSRGWWNCVKVLDVDLDGDLDIIAGNWGLNTRLSASVAEPVSLYRYDFDQNGTPETILTYFYKGKETLLATKDELDRQLPMIKKRYLTYQSFSEATVQELFGASLQKAERRKVEELASCLFLNDGDDNFTKKPLPFSAQSSSVNDIAVSDWSGDGYPDLLLVGNNFEISTQLGRQDALHGVLLINDQNGGFTEHFPQTFDVPGAARKIVEIKVKGESRWLVGRNNDKPVMLKKSR